MRAKLKEAMFFEFEALLLLFWWFLHGLGTWGFIYIYIIIYEWSECSGFSRQVESCHAVCVFPEFKKRRDLNRTIGFLCIFISFVPNFSCLIACSNNELYIR